MIDSQTPDKPWYQRAACRGFESLFDSARIGGSHRPTKDRIRAEKICSNCPVWKECLDEAISREVESDFHSDEGFRAGTTKRDRKRAARKRR